MVVFGVIALTLVAGAGVTFVLRDKLFGADPPSRASALASEPAKEPVPGVLVEPLASGSREVVEPLNSVSGSAAPSASAPLTVRAATSTTPTAVVQAKPAPTVVKPVVNCNPIFTVDASGIQRAKPECLWPE